MAASDTPTITNQLAATSLPSEISPILKSYFWAWFETHQNTVVLKKWFFSIPVAQLEPLFVMLFGPRPTSTV